MTCKVDPFPRFVAHVALQAVSDITLWAPSGDISILAQGALNVS